MDVRPCVDIPVGFWPDRTANVASWSRKTVCGTAGGCSAQKGAVVVLVTSEHDTLLAGINSPIIPWGVGNTYGWAKT